MATSVANGSRNPAANAANASSSPSDSDPFSTDNTPTLSTASGEPIRNVARNASTVAVSRPRRTDTLSSSTKRFDQASMARSSAPDDFKVCTPENT